MRPKMDIGLAGFYFTLLTVASLVMGNRQWPQWSHMDYGEDDARNAEASPPVVHHKRLAKDLIETRSYDPRVRPVNNHAVPINVTIRMNLYQIVEVDERSQHIVLYTWMTQTWEDEFMGWNPTDYGGIDSIVVPYESVWLPDTYLYNGLEMERENSERWISVILEVNKTTRDNTRAKVIFRHPSLYRFTCNLMILYFPFDKQCCKMTFGSWMYDSTGIDFLALQRDIFQEDYTESEEWTVLSFQSEHKRLKYSCCQHPFSHVYAYLLIKRKPLHFLVNLVIPTLIITLISFVGFFSPASTSGERTEKVNLGITTLLAMSILLLMVSDQMPTTSNFIPLIGWFYLSIILLISLATVMTSVIISVQKQGHFGKRVSPRMKKIFFDYAGRIFFMTTPPNIRDVALIVDKPTQETLVPLTRDSSKYDGELLEDALYPSSALDGIMVGGITRNGHGGSRYRKKSPVPVNPPTVCLNLTTFNDISNVNAGTSSQLKTIQRQLLQLTEYVRAKEDEERVHAEWEWLAAILDRILLVLFVTVVTSVTLIIIIVGLLAPQQMDQCHVQ